MNTKDFNRVAGITADILGENYFVQRRQRRRKKWGRSFRSRKRRAAPWVRGMMKDAPLNEQREEIACRARYRMTGEYDF